LNAAVEEKCPRRTEEHIYINLFAEIPGHGAVASILVFEFDGHLNESDFTRKYQPERVISTKIEELIENIKFEREKSGQINDMMVIFGSNKPHVGLIACMYRYKTHEMYGDT
jgi:hypothetical protein